MEKKCSKCGHHLQEAQKFCTACGNKVSQANSNTFTCHKCGKEIEATNKFCPYCGIRLQGGNSWLPKFKNFIIARKKFVIISCITIVVILVTSIIAIVVSNNNSPSSYNNYYGGGYTPSYNYESGTSVLKISNIRIGHNSSYTECTGTIKNTGSKTYSFVKIKGSFKTSSGTVVDTDWTYAVGTEGLAPGESTTFKMSIPKNMSVTTCSISILDYSN